jgi:hypothetical protein
VAKEKRWWDVVPKFGGSAEPLRARAGAYRYKIRLYLCNLLSCKSQILRREMARITVKDLRAEAKSRLSDCRGGKQLSKLNKTELLSRGAAGELYLGG